MPRLIILGSHVANQTAPKVSIGWCPEYSVEVHESAYNFAILGYLPVK